MSVLITGAAGFIGFHLSTRLLERKTPVVGFDNVNPYYSPALKRARIAQLQATAERTGTHFKLIEADLADSDAVEAAFAEHKPKKVVNLAAQAGVRYSIENPAAYIQSNVVGFGHILEGCRQHGVEQSVVRQQQFGVWRKYGYALFRTAQCRSPRKSLCRQQKD